MDPKLVYRCLAKISDWALAGFFSEVDVAGLENVPPRACLVVASSHHNEILDLATLAATIPDGRHLAVWAKSSLFANFFSRVIARSSGCIPVHRGRGGASSAELFHSSTEALTRGADLCVFPEGTSYTEPRIAQVKEGAAWAAVEFFKATRSSKIRYTVVVVPVGIVYSDKSQYQSRVSVRWGKPITVDRYALELDVGSVAADREVVKQLTRELEAALLELTINAPDWDTLYVANLAREIIHERGVPLREFIPISQGLVNDFAAPHPSSAQTKARHHLLHYHSLLHYGGLTHADLTAVCALGSRPTLVRAAGALLHRLAVAVLHPKAIIFLPVCLLHIPAYAIGWGAAHALVPHGEEEGYAQHKVLIGGFGAGVTYAAVGVWAARLALRTVRGSPPRTVLGKRVANRIAGSGLGKLARWLGQRAANGMDKAVGGTRLQSLVMLGTRISSGARKFVLEAGWAKELFLILAGATVVGWLLARWHNKLIAGNYARWKRLSCALTIFMGLAGPQLPESTLGPYLVPPARMVSPYIRPQPQFAPPQVAQQSPKVVAPRRLVRYLLQARTRAVGAVRTLEREQHTIVKQE